MGEFVKAFFISIISATGAFLPVLGVMYIHFRIRKNFYNNIKNNFEINSKEIKHSIGKQKDRLSELYQKIGIKDSTDFITNSELTIHCSIRDAVIMLEENIKNDKITKLENDINFKYIKNYNFR